MERKLDSIRKLASIQKIDEIKSHTNADSLELAKIGGWQIVVKKGQFKAGDLCVYCEMDCLMPEKPEFEFLREKHFRIKFQRLRGMLSQGIAFPLSILCPDSMPDDINGISIIHSINENKMTWDEMIGEEVTEYLGIKKYEPPISPQLMGMAKGKFPTYLLPKTDEERLQSRMKLLQEMEGKLCFITLKEDGTSFTAYHTIEQDFSADIMGLVERVGVCSREVDLKEEAFPGSKMNTYWIVANQYDIKNKLMDFYHDTGRNIGIQGEITGDGINDNRLGLPRNTYQLHLFNIYDIDTHKYVDYAEFILIASILDIPTVETIYFGRFNFTLERLLEMAKGKYEGTQNTKEGIVIRPVNEEFSEALQGRMSFKVINNDHEEEKELKSKKNKRKEGE
jgi:RNA ligase (TIGR02306 family)